MSLRQFFEKITCIERIRQQAAAEAAAAVEEYRAAGFNGEVYLMPVGGVESMYELKKQQVAELAMQYGVRYSDRLQMMWKNAWGV